MVTVHTPAKSRSREQAREVTAELPSNLAQAAVQLDCQGTAIATPSFADEVLKEVLIKRRARSLEVVGAPPRFAELLQRAAVRLKVDERLTVATADSDRRRAVL